MSAPKLLWVLLSIETRTNCFLQLYMPSTHGKTGQNSSVFPKSYGSTTYNAFEIETTPYWTFCQSFLICILHEHIISCQWLTTVADGSRTCKPNLRTGFSHKFADLNLWNEIKHVQYSQHFWFIALASRSVDKYFKRMLISESAKSPRYLETM